MLTIQLAYSAETLCYTLCHLGLPPSYVASSLSPHLSLPLFHPCSVSFSRVPFLYLSLSSILMLIERYSDPTFGITWKHHRSAPHAFNLWKMLSPPCLYSFGTHLSMHALQTPGAHYRLPFGMLSPPTELSGRAEGILRSRSQPKRNVSWRINVPVSLPLGYINSDACFPQSPRWSQQDWAPATHWRSNLIK